MCDESEFVKHILNLVLLWSVVLTDVFVLYTSNIHRCKRTDLVCYIIKKLRIFFCFHKISPLFHNLIPILKVNEFERNFLVNSDKLLSVVF